MLNFCFIFFIFYLMCVLPLTWFANSDDLLTEREKNKLLQEEMESTLHDIQNM